MNTKIDIEEAESAYVVRLERGRQSESDDVEYLYLTPRDAGSDEPRDSARSAAPPPLSETEPLPGPVAVASPSSLPAPPPSGQPSGKAQYEGFTVSHYQVERAIGHGGMGDVYLARDLRLGRPVALKLLRADYQPTEERVSRFHLEARAVCALNHPNIVTVYEVGEVDGAPFIVSEFIEGDTLRQLIPPSGMRLDQALEIAIQIANALASAHQLGIVHRDIKPENVMVRSDGYVKVLDFGLAKLSDALDDRDGQDHSFSTGVVMGTITYMSPEQARGYKVDARTDIFSLGATLYELVTGAKPFTGRTPAEILSAILTREPAPVASYKPDEPPGIQSALTKALRKDRNERYATMTEMIRDLRELKNEIAYQSLQGRNSSPLASPVAESQIIPLSRAGDDPGGISSNTSWPDHLSGKQIGARLGAVLINRVD